MRITAEVRLSPGSRAENGQVGCEGASRGVRLQEKKSMSQERILVVDDDALILESISELLRLEGYDVDSLPGCSAGGDPTDGDPTDGDPTDGDPAGGDLLKGLYQYRY